MIHIRALLIGGLVVAAATQTSLAQAQDDALGAAAYQVLKKHCYQCHGGAEIKVQGLIVSDYKVLVDPESGYVVPKNLDESMIWSRVGDVGDMPPATVTLRPTEQEIDTLKRWIEAGAPPFGSEESRGFIDEVQVLTQIRNHLRELLPRDRKHQRYFSLTHLYNNATVTDDQMRLYRAALSKVANSLSREPDIVLPKAIDAAETIFVVDLRDYGWDDLERWRQVVAAYPYGLSWSDTKARQLADEIDELFKGDALLSDGIPYLRADWFVAKASRPPLYDALIRLPDSESSLATELGVELNEDFLKGKLMRAGFGQSGVSRHNRLIDRHTGTSAAYYYRSHDFGRSSGKGILFRFPLGPKFEGNTFDQHAYEQDGGEIVFSLANGLQGYMIIDKEGKKIDVAPVDVVRDPSEISGTPQVVNGISCLGCHRLGVQKYEDNIRDAFVLSGEARAKVDELYRENKDLAAVQKRDQGRFVQALEATVGPFLRQGDDANRKMEDFPEPIAAIAHLHDGKIGLEEAARELGMTNSQQLAGAIANNEALQKLGLGPLANGHRIPREMWDSKEDFGGSVFQVTARALGRGIPINQK